MGRTTDTLRKYYPHALTMNELLAATQRTSSYGVKPRNTLMCNCTCVDELSNCIEEVLRPHWDWSFWLSGLAGLPFTSKTGWKAALSHVPDKYSQRFMFVIYGPHIGITSDGIYGAVERRGMAEVSSCCGALVGALTKPQPPSVGDYQQDYITAIVNAHRDVVGDSIVKLTDVMYQQIESELFAIVRQNFAVPVVLLGGININTKRENYFQIRNYQIAYPNGKIVNLGAGSGAFV